VPDLIAQGPQVGNRWRRLLPLEGVVLLGRDCGEYSAPWDDEISRQHCELRLVDGKLRVRQLPAGKNALWFRGREVEDCELEAGDHFVVGSTRFHLADDVASVAPTAPQPIEVQSYSSADLRQVRYRHVDHRLEVLSLVPDLIGSAAVAADLHIRLVNLVLAGVPRADAVAIVEVNPDELSSSGTVTDETCRGVRIVHWDRRAGTVGNIHPSAPLVIAALVDERRPLGHIWSSGADKPVFTRAEDVDWAYCCPAPTSGTVRVGIYVTGHFAKQVPLTPTPTDSTDQRDDLKFTNLLAEIFGALVRHRAD
jgi:hypothetical protein